MATSRANLDVTQYVRVAEAGVSVVLQSHGDTVRVVFSNVKPARSNTAYHELGGKDDILNISYTDTDVWVLAMTISSAFTVTVNEISNVAINTLEAGIELGVSCSMTIEIAIPNNGTVYYLLKTPVDNVIRIKGRVLITGGGIRYEPMINAVYTLGTDMSDTYIRNMNGINPEPCELQLWSVTGVTDGTPIDVIRSPNSQGSNDNSTTFGAGGAERILGKDTGYLLKFDNIDNSDTWLIFNIIWTELPE